MATKDSRDRLRSRENHSLQSRKIPKSKERRQTRPWLSGFSNPENPKPAQEVAARAETERGDVAQTKSNGAKKPHSMVDFTESRTVPDSRPGDSHMATVLQQNHQQNNKGCGSKTKASCSKSQHVDTKQTHRATKHDPPNGNGDFSCNDTQPNRVSQHCDTKETDGTAKQVPPDDSGYSGVPSTSPTAKSAVSIAMQNTSVGATAAASAKDVSTAGETVVKNAASTRVPLAANRPDPVDPLPVAQVVERALEAQSPDVDFQQEISRLKSLSSESFSVADINPEIFSAISKYIDLVNMKEKSATHHIDGAATATTAQSDDDYEPFLRSLSSESVEDVALIDPQRLAEVGEYIDVLRQKSSGSFSIAKDDHGACEDFSRIESFLERGDAGSNDLLAYLSQQAAQNKSRDPCLGSVVHEDPPTTCASATSEEVISQSDLGLAASMSEDNPHRDKESKVAGTITGDDEHSAFDVEDKYAVQATGSGSVTEEQQGYPDKYVSEATESDSADTESPAVEEQSLPDHLTTEIIADAASCALKRDRKAKTLPTIQTRFDPTHAESSIELVGEILSPDASASFEGDELQPFDRYRSASGDKAACTCSSTAKSSITMFREFLSCEEAQGSDKTPLADRSMAVTEDEFADNEAVEERPLELSNERKEDDGIDGEREAADNKGPPPPDISSQLVEAIRKLYPLLAGLDNFFDKELDAFEELIRYSFPLIDGKEPTALHVSQILSRAKKLSISLDAADRFLEANSLLLRTMDSAQSTEDDQPLEGDRRLLSFLGDILKLIDSYVKQGEAGSIERIGVVTSHQIASTTGEESVEVEVNDGYISKEDALRANDEPWWEVAARLNGAAVDETEFLQFSESRVTDSFALEPDVASNSGGKPTNNVEEDIDQFWKQRKTAQEQQSRLTRKTKSRQRRKRRPRVDSTSQSGSNSTRTSKSLFSSETSATSYDEKVKEAWTRIRKKGSMLHREMIREAPSSAAPDPINAVAAVSNILQRTTPSERRNRNHFPFSNSWRKPYAQRTQNHDGFLGIDVHSLFDSSSVQTRRHHLDDQPWESRNVKQRFLHEQSVSLSRNWFGSLAPTKGNKRVHLPVCRPASMEMPMQASAWTEEWYRPKNPYRDLLKRDDDDDDESEDASWEEIPECGKIKNVKLKIGDRISRVTPDLTSSLRRSRWRKKHFQHHFPY